MVVSEKVTPRFIALVLLLFFAIAVKRETLFSVFGNVDINKRKGACGRSAWLRESPPFKKGLGSDMDSWTGQKAFVVVTFDDYILHTWMAVKSVRMCNHSLCCFTPLTKKYVLCLEVSQIA